MSGGLDDEIKSNDKDGTIPQYVYDETFLSDSELSELKGLLNIDSMNYVTSHVYNRISKENFIDKHLRSSEKIEYREEIIFNWLENHLVKKLNSQTSSFSFALVRNDVEVVKYKLGDFFKKHQDYVNFDSNEFKNFTVLLCLVAPTCDVSQSIGGETLLYLDGPDSKATSFRGTGQIPGSLLALQKTVIHEGAEISSSKGSKIILKANLICFSKMLEQQDLIIVDLKKNHGKQYVLPANCLDKDSIYFAFYNFKKRLTPTSNRFYFEEIHMDESTFKLLYPKLIGMSVDDTRNFKTEQKKLQKELIAYAGITPVSKYTEYNSFINEKKSPIWLCTMNDYYKFLNCPRPDTVLPFQLVTLESDGKRCILWFGIFDNIFGTCDLQSLLPENMYDHDGKGMIEDIYKEKFPNGQITIDGKDDFVPDRSWSSWNDYDSLRKYAAQLIWKNNLFNRRLHDVLKREDKDKNSLQRMHEYIHSIIGKFTADDSDGSTTFFHIPDKKYVKAEFASYKMTDTSSDTPTCNVPDSVKKLNIVDIIDFISKQEIVSDMDSTQMSEFHCNETSYTTFNVPYKFGFLHLDQL